MNLRTSLRRPTPQELFSAIASALTSDTAVYVLKRCGQAAIALLLASMFCFLIAAITPGDYLDTLSQNPQISQDLLDRFREEFGLDRSIWEQYRRWIWQIVRHGNFGESFAYRRPVVDLIGERIPATLLMALLSLVFTWAIGIPLGILAAINHNRWIDRALVILSYVGQSFPSFITALGFLFVAQSLSPWLPIGGMTSLNHSDLPPLGKLLDILWHAFLPVLALSVTGFAGLQRLMRGQLLDVLRQDYVRTARAKGLPEHRVIYVHALRNAVNPLIVLLGFEFSSLLGGSFITEYFFNWPGLGRLILQAVQVQDLYLTMASLMMGAVLLIVGNLLADLLLKAVDPRIQLNNPR